MARQGSTAVNTFSSWSAKWLYVCRGALSNHTGLRALARVEVQWLTNKSLVITYLLHSHTSASGQENAHTTTAEKNLHDAAVFTNVLRWKIGRGAGSYGSAVHATQRVQRGLLWAGSNSRLTAVFKTGQSHRGRVLCVQATLYTGRYSDIPRTEPRSSSC